MAPYPEAAQSSFGDECIQSQESCPPLQYDSDSSEESDYDEVVTPPKAAVVAAPPQPEPKEDPKAVAAERKNRDFDELCAKLEREEEMIERKRQRELNKILGIREKKVDSKKRKADDKMELPPSKVLKTTLVVQKVPEVVHDTTVATPTTDETPDQEDEDDWGDAEAEMIALLENREDPKGAPVSSPEEEYRLLADPEIAAASPPVEAACSSPKEEEKACENAEAATIWQKIHLGAKRRREQIEEQAEREAAQAAVAAEAEAAAEAEVTTKAREIARAEVVAQANELIQAQPATETATTTPDLQMSDMRPAPTAPATSNSLQQRIPVQHTPMHQAAHLQQTPSMGTMNPVTPAMPGMLTVPMVYAQQVLLASGIQRNVFQQGPMPTAPLNYGQYNMAGYGNSRAPMGGHPPIQHSGERQALRWTIPQPSTPIPSGHPLAQHSRAQQGTMPQPSMPMSWVLMRGFIDGRSLRFAVRGNQRMVERPGPDGTTTWCSIPSDHILSTIPLYQEQSQM